MKNVRTQEVVIGGWTEGKGELAGTLGALLLGIPEGDGLRYAGKVGTGFSDQARARAPRRPAGRSREDASPFTRALSRPEAALAHYVRPDARRRGAVRGVDPRGPSPAPVVAGAARRQGTERGGP